MLTQLEEDVVRKIVEDFVSKDALFTALDISNEVKKVFAHVRHRDVREMVRSLFTTFMEPAGWARSDIDVTLKDGTTAKALLYYPLSASWDLDTQYNDQKRSQVSDKPAAAQASTTQTVTAQAVASQVVNTAVTPAVVAQAVVTQAANTAHEMWKNLFNSKPSLFPMK